MKCEELSGLFELYALDALERGSAEEIDRHLAQRCEACMANLARAASLNAILLAMVPDAKPPRTLRYRLLASIGFERARWGWVGALATALMLLLALWLGYEERQRGYELTDTRMELMRVSSERDHLSQALAFLADPATKSTSFGRKDPAQPRGNVFLHSQMGVMLIVSNLPEADRGKTYELWLHIKGAVATPKPAGIFQSDGKRALHVLEGPIDVGDIASISVTLEPETGSASPTTMALFTAQL